jgi:hypothetical protein
MVMAETQKSPESVRPTERLHAQWIRQDSAACVSLSSIYLSKSAGAKRPQTNGPARCRPVAAKTKPITQLPGEASYQSGDCLPTAAHQYMAHEGLYLISTMIRVNGLVKKYCAARVPATPCLPQNGRHCNTHT